jgi:NADPH-dependent glutamate synthase beta subunit-like oxidoreductase
VPATDGAKMIHSISPLEQVEKGRALVRGRIVGVIGGGDAAMDAARVDKRLGADEGCAIYARIPTAIHISAWVHPHQ